MGVISDSFQTPVRDNRGVSLGRIRKLWFRILSAGTNSHGW